MSSFRASPWISFQPPPPAVEHNNMDEDVDMDAPQISTLREEETPPPVTRAAAPKARRLKLLVKEPPAPAAKGEDDDEDEDQEDQLIDDDDELASKPSASRATGETPTKRKAATKRKPRKTEKRAPEESKKIRLKVPLPSSTSAMTSAEVTPESRGDEDLVRLDSSEVHPIPIPVTASDSISSGRPAKKPRKEPAKPRARKGPKKRVQDLHLPPEDSEANTATAASSPVTAPLDMTSEPEIELEVEIEAEPLPPPPLLDDPNLDNIPVPVYPLPAKPFPVQPPPKFGSGFAPMIPLDRSGRKVRHWRIANREIRGIAGGRWFARSYVGEKDSDYSFAQQAKMADAERISALTLPKLVAASISTPPSGRGPGKLKAAKHSASVRTQSAGSSRAGSVIADTTARPPTKMRTMVSAAPLSDYEGIEIVDPPADRDVEMVPIAAE
ncbi:hypothetical protein HGRIS_008505 [Hohenbuehelia grisea]|uniref:AP2/ERF domain-containing protein n=1 Tax=Hohenbuehelia grisea TaxID=104357 RepID=A0ABR3J859_9AGAR